MKKIIPLIALLCFTAAKAQTLDSTVNGLLQFIIGEPFTRYSDSVVKIPSGGSNRPPLYYSYNNFTPQTVNGIPFKSFMVGFDSARNVYHISLVALYVKREGYKKPGKAKEDGRTLLQYITGLWGREGKYNLLYENGKAKHFSYKWLNNKVMLRLVIYYSSQSASISIDVSNSGMKWYGEND